MVKCILENGSNLNTRRLDLSFRHLPELNLRTGDTNGQCCFLCPWATGEKLSSQLLQFADCSVSLCSWCYGLYHTTSSLDDNMKLWLANEVAKRKSSKGKSKVNEKRTKK